MNQENNYMYFPYENCHFLIDFDADKCTSLEPCCWKQSKDWSVMKSVPFLIQDKSNSFFRAFYIPFLTDSYGNFNLLKRYQKFNKKGLEYKVEEPMHCTIRWVGRCSEDKTNADK
uniref:Mannosyltransferase n=1 Tax=Glossina palpalis gambiensis TaxID=67801 RepID=A0A1B0C241_9MUSC